MELPETVLQTYRLHFREIREIAGGSLHFVLEHFRKLKTVYGFCWIASWTGVFDTVMNCSNRTA